MFSYIHEIIELSLYLYILEKRTGTDAVAWNNFIPFTNCYHLRNNRHVTLRKTNKTFFSNQKC